MNMKRIEDGHRNTFPKIWSVGMERPFMQFIDEIL